MNWCCFKFWFYYRLILVCLAHINWIVAVYVNCVYFVLWKSYDLLWFWSHFILCLCCVALRSENYLLVWFNILYKRWTKYPKRSAKEIYILEYGKKREQVKSERELYDLGKRDEFEKEDHENRNDREVTNRGSPSNQFRMDNAMTSGTDISHTSSSSSSDEKNKFKKDRRKRACEVMVIGEEEQDCMKQLYIGRAIDSEPGPHQEEIYSTFGNKAYIDVSRQELQAMKKKKRKTGTSSTTLLSSAGSDEKRYKPKWYKRLFSSSCGQRSDELCPHLAANKSTSGGNTADEESVPVPGHHGAGSSSSHSEYDNFKDAHSSSVDLLKPNFTNTFDAENESVRLKREKKERKALARRIRERKRLQLLMIAKKEAKARLISSSIELFLQLLRMVSSFALLVGNIRKTFIPASIRYVKPGHVELPIMAIFRLTIFLDVFLFWASFMWAYCLQWHLCCRLGLCKFWLWTLTLVLIGTFVMVLPMSEIQKELDPSWCRFKLNSSYAVYQPRW